MMNKNLNSETCFEKKWIFRCATQCQNKVFTLSSSVLLKFKTKISTFTEISYSHFLLQIVQNSSALLSKNTPKTIYEVHLLAGYRENRLLRHSTDNRIKF